MFENSIYIPPGLDEWIREENISESLHSSVWLVKNKNNGGKAVLKVLHPVGNLSDPADAVERVLLAAECPHTVEIISAFYDADGDMGYVLMPVYRSLYEYRAQRKMESSELILMAQHVLEAVESLHRRGMIHADIKPENIFVDSSGSFLLGDLDSVCPLGSHPSEITREYAAPEVVKGNAAGETSDIYSLALVLYSFMNHGRLPFLPSGSQLISAEAREDAVKRRLEGGRIPLPAESRGALGEAVCRACSFHPDKRFGSAAEFREALLSVPHAEKSRKRLRVLKCLCAAAVIIASAGVIYSRAYASGEKEKADNAVS